MEQGAVLAGRYRITRRLSQGGMGCVWLAADLSTGDRVAVKEIIAGSGLPAAEVEVMLRRFEREARLPGMLNHPGIIRVYEVVSYRGAPMIVMECLDSNLADEINSFGGRISVARAIGIAAGLLNALAAIHAAGIVHRDLKPANVLMNSGQPVITDFGIAAIAQGTQLTRTGDAPGTLPYMAPEVLLGEGATAASDMWALGVMLYEAVEGAAPFHGASPRELMGAILNHAPSAPVQAGALDSVILELLAKEPTRRPTARNLLHQEVFRCYAPTVLNSAPPARATRPTLTAPRPESVPSARPATAPPSYPVVAPGQPEPTDLARSEVERLRPVADRNLTSLNGCGLVFLAAVLNVIGALIVGTMIEVILNYTQGPLAGKPTPPWDVPTSLAVGSLLWILPALRMAVRASATNAARRRIEELDHKFPGAAQRY